MVSDDDRPGTDGVKLLQAVRERDPELPFLPYTGTGAEAVAGEVISPGMTDYRQTETGTATATVPSGTLKLANVVSLGKRSR